MALCKYRTGGELMANTKDPDYVINNDLCMGNLSLSQSGTTIEIPLSQLFKDFLKTLKSDKERIEYIRKKLGVKDSDDD